MGTLSKLSEPLQVSRTHLDPLNPMYQLPIHLTCLETRFHLEAAFVRHPLLARTTATNRLKAVSLISDQALVPVSLIRL